MTSKQFPSPSQSVGCIGIIGTLVNVEFPANQTKYGLTRNGNWGQASIPISEIRGEFIDLRMLSYEFVILEVNGAACEFALDDIFWDGGTPGLGVQDLDIPRSFKLGEVFPNPFNGYITIPIYTEYATNATIDIIDIQGKRVDVLFENKSLQWQNATQIQWNGNNFSSGVYFVRVQTDTDVQLKKMSLVK